LLFLERLVQSVANTRQQIMEAAERIIRAKGIVHATTKEIAREAGFAEGTLYKHFERKEDLLLAVLQQQLPRFIESVDAQLASKGSVRENFENIAREAMAYYTQLLLVAMVFFQDVELLARHQEVMQQINGGPQRIYERVASYVEEEQRLGRIDIRQQPLSIAALLLGPCFHYVFNRHLLGRSPLPLTDEQFIAGTIETLLAAIAPK
jgi:AcrR family transcriptional regulator